MDDLNTLEPSLHKSEADKIHQLASLSKTTEFLSQINHLLQIDNQPEENTTNEDSSLTESQNLDGTRPEIEDVVELLCEQVESLQLLLHYKQLELHQLQQELSYTNEDLCAALNSGCLTLNEAKKLVKNILVSKKPISLSLAKLLSTIYNSSVKASDLEEIDQSNSITPLTSELNNRLLTQFEMLRTMMMAQKKQSSEIRAKSRKIREQSREIRVQSRELKADYNELGSQFVSFQASFMSRQANYGYTEVLKNLLQQQKPLD